MTKPRILWMSESPVMATGFGTVTKETLSRLASSEDFEIACLGWGYDGWPYDRGQVPYEVFPSCDGEFGKNVFPRAIEVFQPDLVIAFGDIWMFEWLCRSPRPRPFQTWGYFPVDGVPFHPAWSADLAGLDRSITLTEFGRETIVKDFPEHQPDVIYHGVDTAVFRPAADKEAHKKKHGLDGKFVVGCVARNQPRKQLPILIEAFAEFARNKEDVLLYLHTDPDDIGWDIHDLLRRHGIRDITGISQQAKVNGGTTRTCLGDIYNFMDVMALPTAGEGFGLPILEAMACGVPVITTDYSACVELVKGRGQLVKVSQFLTVGRYNIRYAIPDSQDFIHRMERLYENPDLRAEHSRNGLEFARTLTWEAIVDQWMELLMDWKGSRRSTGSEPDSPAPGGTPSDTSTPVPVLRP